MKKIVFQGLVLALVTWCAVSCQKESPFLSKELEEEALSSAADLKASCQLTSYDYYNGDAHAITSYTHKNGLLEDVLTTYGWRFNMEYNKQKKLIAATVYDGETLLYEITFMYDKNRVVKEIWRDVSTQQIYDEVFLTYDQKGNIIRSESFLREYVVENTYSVNRSLISWKISDFGTPTVKGEYTYNANYKNPYKAINGVDYQFWYTNSAFGFGTGNTWYSSEKITLYNEGEPFVLYEQDPAKTVWQVGKQHYPLQASYVLKGSNATIKNTFGYENCNPSNSSPSISINKMGSSKSTKQEKSNPYFRHPHQNAIEKLRGSK